MITAILDMGVLQGKLHMKEFMQEIRIPVIEAMTITWLQEAFVPNSPHRHKILIFRCKRRISRYKYQYLLQEIE